MDEMTSGYKPVIEEICGLDWTALNQSQLSAVAWAYYYFSIQFRENLTIAHDMHPDDAQLQSLVREECDTSNLSPWPEVAMPGEKMNHDEFMRRVLHLSPIDRDVQAVIEAAGEKYLASTRLVDDVTRARLAAQVRDAMLTGRHWDTPLLEGFRHFLEKHIDFDSDPEVGHGALIRHLVPDDRIRCLWVDFRDLLIQAVPRLAM